MFDDQVHFPSRRALLQGGMASVTLATFPLSAARAETAGQWSREAAAAWYRKQPWLVGSNYTPANAVNQLEMWQAQTFDPARIDRELGWAAEIPLNVMRVFLHDLAWLQDPIGFRERIETFLAIASRRRIRVLFVFFDSCWDPLPRPGPQPDPVPGVHNSRWVQSPGAAALADTAQHARLRDYVHAVLGAFGKDERVLAWDLWNEPGNLNPLSYGAAEPPNKLDLVAALLPNLFGWAREVNPVQPLTSAVWGGLGNWSRDESLTPIERIQLGQSDVISFHHYGWPEDFERRVRSLQRYERPILCTEYMARPLGSTFDLISPVAKELGVAALNWGFAVGRTQTWLPWSSWQHPEMGEPEVWFHDIFRENGTPYRDREIALLSRLAAS